ncbi:uncharacterized protein [Argopecten irradians]|uniref:uncharacterized protein n=1 Tax=Argopecten irradians TaxID=31199 RepID=UPI0037127B8C
MGFNATHVTYGSTEYAIQLNSTFTISSAADDDTSGLITDKTFDANKEINLTASFDVSRQTNDDPSEVIERSITDPDLPDEILPEAAVTYSIVENGSQRNQRKLVSSDGYEYTKKCSKGDFTYWRCAKRSKSVNCPATVSQKGDNYKENSRQHIHGSDKGALKKAIVRKEVKAAARRDITKTARRIVEDVMLDNIEEADHQLPKVNNLRRMANQVREDLRPQEPKDLDFEVNVDVEFLQCGDFLIGDLRVDDQRHLIFATPQQLQILKHARRLFCDGTFKITPEPFVQTWSIHAFINRGDSYKQVPLVFCLMSRRKTSDYVANMILYASTFIRFYVYTFIRFFDYACIETIKHHDVEDGCVIIF